MDKIGPKVATLASGILALTLAGTVAGCCTSPKPDMGTPVPMDNGAPPLPPAAGYERHQAMNSCKGKSSCKGKMSKSAGTHSSYAEVRK